MSTLFYHSLLVNDACSYFRSQAQGEAGEVLLEKICASHGLPSPFPKHALQLNECVDLNEFGDVDDDEGDHADKLWKTESERFRTLILEESRHTIAEALHRRWNQSRFQIGLELWVEFEEIKEDAKKSHRALFNAIDIKRRSRLFPARAQLDLMRPGTVVELHPVGNGRVKVENILLGTFEPKVWTTEKNPKMLKDRRAIVLGTTSKDIPSDGIYRMYPLTSLLSYARQFQATSCLRPDLYPTLMPSSPETKSEIASQDKSEGGDSDCVDSKDMNTTPMTGENNVASNLSETAEADIHHFDVPSMNECQEEASTGFLTSSPGSITLVQGPPGTGKTSMLTATICNFLITRSKAGDEHPRLMVCAPSNKAVAVLAARYLEAAKGLCKFKAAMVGDKDKILSEDQTRRFEGIFVYTWLQNTLKELQAIAISSTMNVTTKQAHIRLIADTLYAVLPRYALHQDRGVPSLIADILEKIASVPMKRVPPHHAAPKLCIIQRGRLRMALKKLGSVLAEMERYIQLQLLNNANVIFCTLSSAGSTIIKRTDPIEALIVDEAAAACEPETYIPIASKRPRYIMIVGDPKQLPPTIMSPIAKARGLGKSLQERHMFDEQQPHTMFKVQYRMRPEISIFPSAAFYEGRISNGANVTSAKYETGIYRNLVKKQPYCFVQVDGVEERQQSGSFHNVKEAEQVAAILLETRHRSRCTGLAQNNQWCSSSRIRVITFYQAQVDLISATLKANGLADVSVSTVDSCQGSEADLVVISFVRTGQTNTIGFLSDNRRLNVALTRAKHKLVCVGRAENGLSQVISRGAETMRALIENVVDRKILAKEYDPKVKVIRPNCWIPHHRGGGTTTNRPHPHQRHKKPPVSKKRSQDKSRGPAKRPKH